MSNLGFVSELSDEEIVEKTSTAGNGEKFGRLWAGDNSDYDSRSEAGLALCSHLVFCADDNPDRSGKLFRQSGLYRSKWDERHYGDGRIYGQAPIEKALGSATKLYTVADDKWEAPVPLPEGLPPVATLDPAMVPEPLRGWILDVSERMQIPPDFAAAGAVIAPGSLIGPKMGIHPKRQDDWLVVPNLWGAVVGRPSLMKILKNLWDSSRPRTLGIPLIWARVYKGSRLRLCELLRTPSGRSSHGPGPTPMGVRGQDWLPSSNIGLP